MKTSGVAVALLGAALSFNVLAQGYPDKAVRVVVPFPAGGAADIVARQLTMRLSPAIGQQIIVITAAARHQISLRFTGPTTINGARW